MADYPRVYLAARFARKQEIAAYRDSLAKLGFTVTARWLDSHSTGSETIHDISPQEAQRFALEDWEDLTNADIVISFTEEPMKVLAQGGRHVEFGAAYILNKRCILVGPRENVFHYLPGLIFYDSWPACEKALAWEAYKITSARLAELADLDDGLLQ